MNAFLDLLDVMFRWNDVIESKQDRRRRRQRIARRRMNVL